MRPPIRKLARKPVNPVESPETEIPITSEFITLGQLLKSENLIGTGGEAKLFLAEMTVTVNGERDDRRGRKLRPDDLIRIPGVGNYRIMVSQTEPEKEPDA